MNNPVSSSFPQASISEHGIIPYGTSLWSTHVGYPVCVRYKPLFPSPPYSPLRAGAEWETEAILMLCKNCVVNTVLVTNQNQSTIQAAMKKVNARPSTRFILHCVLPPTLTMQTS